MTKPSPSLRETDPTAEEGARTKAAKPSNLLGFAFLLLTAYDTARPDQAPAPELLLISI
jgi:hypothetical protein